ncbi:MAG: hypothetical protein ABS52_09225 [Gemmatimonadetes bacterium SCN 70-22]|nr:MAG: hypothetical protein ABS52_09225 [Gemmatimonadetes bacterium SCN 70-22]
MLGAQDAGAPLPFGIGEELRYQVTAGRWGRVGRGTMSVEGPEDVRGHRALLLRFEVRGRIGPVSVVNRTDSWVTPSPLASLRFSKYERQFIHRRDERVEIFPPDQRWRSHGDVGDAGEAGEAGAAGDGGTTPTDAPLDELSFIYFLRTLPLSLHERHSLSRHFRAERNPVEVTVLGREVITVPAGVFATVVVEMRVKDRRHYDREGVLRLHLTDDRAHVPVRIETAMPVVGTTVLVLESRRDGATTVVGR